MRGTHEVELCFLLALIIFLPRSFFFQVYKVSVPALASTQQSEVVLGLNGNSNKNGKSNGVQGVPLPTTKPVRKLYLVVFCRIFLPFSIWPQDVTQTTV